MAQVVQIETMGEDIKAMEDDGAAFGRIANAEGTFNVTEAAKAQGVQPKKLFTWLSHNGWIYRRAGAKNWLGYERKRVQGLLDHKTSMGMRSDGVEQVNEHLWLTPKGLAKLAKLVGTENKQGAMDYETGLSGGFVPGELTFAQDRLSPGEGEVPVLFLMDAEYDPVFFQFGSIGTCCSVPRSYRWIALTPEHPKILGESGKKAVEMWAERDEDETNGTETEAPLPPRPETT